MVFELDGVGVDLGGVPVLRDVSFRVASGERVVLLGVNGCGKTTLLRLLDGLLPATRGAVRYGGHALDARALEDAAFRRRFRGEVGFLFQNVDAMLFNPSVADEIAFGPRQLGLADAEARVGRWAGAFEVAGFLDRPPFALSGGEKKRVALAALLAVDPTVLLLDEATAGLDPASVARLVDVLAGIRGLTVVATTHNLSMATELGDRAVLLAPGRRGVLHDGDAHAHYHVHDAE